MIEARGQQSYDMSSAKNTFAELARLNLSSIDPVVSELSGLLAHRLSDSATAAEFVDAAFQVVEDAVAGKDRVTGEEMVGRITGLTAQARGILLICAVPALARCLGSEDFTTSVLVEFYRANKEGRFTTGTKTKSLEELMG